MNETVSGVAEAREAGRPGDDALGPRAVDDEVHAVVEVIRNVLVKVDLDAEFGPLALDQGGGAGAEVGLDEVRPRAQADLGGVSRGLRRERVVVGVEQDGGQFSSTADTPRTSRPPAPSRGGLGDHWSATRIMPPAPR